MVRGTWSLEKKSASVAGGESARGTWEEARWELWATLAGSVQVSRLQF